MNFVRRIALLAVGLLALAGCSTLDDVLGVDSGHVQMSCAGSGSLPAAAPLQSSLSPLTPRTMVEVVRAEPQGPVLLTLPNAAVGDDFSYAWKETAVGTARPPGVWQCRVEWQYDGQFWRLLNFDSRWVGGVN